MKCTGMLNGNEWWYGFLSRMETISIREGLASRSPFVSVRSTDLWQYTAYFPTSLLGGRKWHESGYGTSGMRFWAAHLGSALRCRYCFRYHRKCCWGRKRATHRDSSCQHCRSLKTIHFFDKSSAVEIKHHTCGLPYLCQGVVVRHPLVGLLDKLTVHLILELRVRQAHLQGILGQ